MFGLTISITPHSPKCTSFNISLDSFGPRRHNGSLLYPFLNRMSSCIKYWVTNFLSLYLPLCQKILALHPWPGIYHGEFLLWCEINAQDWQVTKTFMTCLVMRDRPSFDYMFVQYSLLQRRVHQLQWWVFYNTRKCNYEEKLSFWQCRLLREALGPLDLLGEPLDSWHLEPLAILKFWQFGSLGNLDLGPSWPLWHLVIPLMI